MENDHKENLGPHHWLRSAVVAQELFLQGQTIQSSLSKNLEADTIKRKTEVARNRSIVIRIVDTIVFLGGQGPLQNNTATKTDLALLDQKIDKLTNFVQKLAERV